MTTDTIISKVWSFCTTLRDDGVGYGDYLEQLTYLIFLKMADEYGRPPYNRNVGVPKKYAWPTLKSLKGAELEVHYVETLSALSTEKGMLGQIFTKSQNKITDPAKLARLIEMVDGVEWVMLGSDTKGDIYEGILEKNAEDTKSGAGQYFTLRALIAAMVECMAPEPGKTISDPACGTGGFFLAAYDYLVKTYKLDKDQKASLKNGTFHGNEIVAGTRRLCLMNLFLHNIGEIDGESCISAADALVAQPSKTVDYVLANPPFGKKSSMTFTNEEGEQEKDDLTYNRQDFWATTSNKQLNFLQHIRSMLKTTGRAAVVLPDNVLFEGGAGETVRKKLLETTELHTILRLPTGIFYAQGVKANVLFFDNRPASKDAATKEVWYYDYRTNIHHTLKRKTLRLEDLREFISCYNPANRHKREATWHPEKAPEGRWRKFTYEELAARDKTSLDLFWLKDDSLADLDNLPEPADLAEEIIDNIESGLLSFRAVAAALQPVTPQATSLPESKPVQPHAANQSEPKLLTERDPIEDSRPGHPDELEKSDLMSILREVLTEHGPCDRDTAIKQAATSLGYQRVSANLSGALSNAIRTAVRRQVLFNEGGQFRTGWASITGYDMEFLKSQFLAAISEQGRVWTTREDAIRAFARWFGFRRTGSVIDETARKLIKRLLRENRLEKDGDSIRRV